MCCLSIDFPSITSILYTVVFTIFTPHNKGLLIITLQQLFQKKKFFLHIFGEFYCEKSSIGIIIHCILTKIMLHNKGQHNNCWSKNDMCTATIYKTPWPNELVTTVIAKTATLQVHFFCSLKILYDAWTPTTGAPSQLQSACPSVWGELRFHKLSTN